MLTYPNSLLPTFLLELFLRSCGFGWSQGAVQLILCSGPLAQAQCTLRDNCFHLFPVFNNSASGREWSWMRSRWQRGSTTHTALAPARPRSLHTSLTHICFSKFSLTLAPFFPHSLSEFFYLTSIQCLDSCSFSHSLCISLSFSGSCFYPFPPPPPSVVTFRTNSRMRSSARVNTIITVWLHTLRQEIN